MSAYQEINVPTINPCPSWCTLGAGHGYDVDDPSGPMRSHEREIGLLQEASYGEAGDVDLVVAVTLESLELLRTTRDGIGVEEWVSPHIVLDASDNNMSGPQARRVAAMLLNAADLWDLVAKS